MATQLDIIVESVNGLHIRMATVGNEAHGVLVAEALYKHLQTTPPSTTQARYVWLRSCNVDREGNETNQHLLRAWPEAWQDEKGHAASVAAWKVSPRGVSGDESEPDEATTRQAIEAELARLPERYQPQELTCTAGQYRLSVAGTAVLYKLYAREAIHQARRYVDDHERAGWKMPIGVVNGIYD